MPNLRAATISAPSVGSPCTRQRPSLLDERRVVGERGGAQRPRDGVAHAARLGERRRRRR